MKRQTTKKIRRGVLVCLAIAYFGYSLYSNESMLTGVKNTINQMLVKYGIAKTPKQLVNTDQYLPEALDWSFEKYPNYYKVLGRSNIMPSDFPKAGTVIYGGKDVLGRTLEVKGSLTFANVKGSYGNRGQFAENDNPSGWQGNETIKGTDGQYRIKPYRIDWLYGKFYNGAFFNKSHLIADSLGGRATSDNAVTAPRTQNVGGADNQGGMRYPEQKAQQYLESRQSSILYYASIPIYKDNELVPRAVVVNLMSDDKVIDESVIVYNTANGYSINYQDGTFLKVN